jgi:hypothetical protein
MRLMDGIYFLSPHPHSSDTDVPIIASPAFKKSKYLSDIKIYLVELFNKVYYKFIFLAAVLQLPC